jgi:hypothetical protein
VYYCHSQITFVLYKVYHKGSVCQRNIKCGLYCMYTYLYLFTHNFHLSLMFNIVHKMFIIWLQNLASFCHVLFLVLNFHVYKLHIDF